jgi:hypothetical protein
MILQQGASVLIAGLVVGFVVALAGSRLLNALLYDMNATDPATYSIREQRHRDSVRAQHRIARRHKCERYRGVQFRGRGADRGPFG